MSATDGTAFTGAVTVRVTGDNGTQAVGSVGSGACTHKGSGYHSYAPAAAETNYDHVAFTYTGTGAIPVTVQVYPRAATPSVNVSQISGDSIAADNLEAALDGTGGVTLSATLSDLESTLADSIPADGSRPSVKQALYLLTQFMLERAVSGTTVTVKKPDGTTALFTLALDNATNPTSITRAS